MVSNPARDVARCQQVAHTAGCCWLLLAAVCQLRGQMACRTQGLASTVLVWRAQPPGGSKLLTPGSLPWAVQEAGALDAVAIKGGNDVAPTAATSGFVRTYATSYFGYDLWAGTTGGAGSQLLLIRLGWYPLLTLDDTDATVSSFAAAGGTDASGQQYMLTAAVTTTDLAALAGKVATGGGGMQAVFYCVKGSQDDGSFIQDTYLPAFTDCRSWQAATPTLLGDLLALNCSACQGSSCVNMSEPTAEEVREQQVQQATSSFETQRQAATAVSAATVAVATAGSAAASAAVSSMAAQAAAALGAMGAQVGMEGALASIGISGLVNHLQMFALSGARQARQGLSSGSCSLPCLCPSDTPLEALFRHGMLDTLLAPRAAAAVAAHCHPCQPLRRGAAAIAAWYRRPQDPSTPTCPPPTSTWHPPWSGPTSNSCPAAPTRRWRRTKPTWIRRQQPMAPFAAAGCTTALPLTCNGASCSRALSATCSQGSRCVR